METDKLVLFSEALADPDSEFSSLSSTAALSLADSDPDTS